MLFICRLNLFSLVFVSLFIFCGCGSEIGHNGSIEIKPFDVKGIDTLKTNSGLQYLLVKKNPTGKTPSPGKQVKVHYTGFFLDGKIFDSSIKRGEALPFTLGVGKVIAGWDEGIGLLHVGEKARFIIPYQLAYGIEGSGSIPPMSTLIFDVALIEAE